jgi:16S rRNA processing protein RimM
MATPLTTDTHTAAPSAWVALAVYAQPHGVSGRIKVKSFTDPLDDFATHAGLCDERGNPVKLRITGHAQGMAIVEVEGIATRDQAELLRGRKLGIARTALPELTNPNAYYIDDLIGLTVITADGGLFGTVKNVMNYGAGDILEIKRPNGKEDLLSFTHASFPTVDIAQKTIVISPPEIIDARANTHS